jgi:2-octaprenyl-3-methyl-6-methoxy-1,4-benzoquinol hydroxylase
MLWSRPDQYDRNHHKPNKNPVNLGDSGLRIIAMTIHATDVAIVGGGMVGGALALGLAQQGFTVTVIEKTRHRHLMRLHRRCAYFGNQRRIGRAAESLGVWDACGHARHAYRQLETWEWESAHVSLTPRS